MSADLPDYTRKVIVDQEIEGSTHLAVDLEKVKGDDILEPTIANTVPVGIENENIKNVTATPTVEHTFPVSVENPAIANATADPTVEHTVPVSVENPAIKNATATPTVANTVPISVENDALAYDATNDEFYVRSKSTARPIYADLRTLVGAAISKTNPLNVRLGDGTDDIPFPTALDTDAFKVREQNPITGFATQTTLALIAGYVDGIEALLGAGLPALLDTGALKTREQGTPTVTVGTFPDNEPFNLNQVGGTTQTGHDLTDHITNLDAALSTRARLQPWYQTNFTRSNQSYVASGVAPHANTVRWTYTVPASRIAIIMASSALIVREVAPTTAGQVQAFMDINGTTRVLQSFHVNATVGASDYANASQGAILIAADVLYGKTGDGSTGGFYAYIVGANIMEFDV